MKLPKLENTEKFTGLYIFDFGDHAGVGYTADEIALLLESEKYADGKVYRIHRANPDGTMELKGVPAQTFELEKGFIFFAADEQTGWADFGRLADIAGEDSPPCRARLELAAFAQGRLATVLLYPAEYDDQISSWLRKAEYMTAGEVLGGLGAADYYYNHKSQAIKKQQLWSDKSDSRSAREVFDTVNEPVQRKFA